MAEQVPRCHRGPGVPGEGVPQCPVLAWVTCSLAPQVADGFLHPRWYPMGFLPSHQPYKGPGSKLGLAPASISSPVG